MSRGNTTTTTSVRTGVHRKNRGGGPGSFGHGFCLYARQSWLAGTNKRERRGYRYGESPALSACNCGGAMTVQVKPVGSCLRDGKPAGVHRTSIGKSRFDPGGVGHPTHLRSRELSFRRFRPNKTGRTL